MIAIPESLLIARCCSGDELAYSMLFKRHYSFVEDTLARFAVDGDDLADLVQETWVKVFQALPRFRQTCKFTSWMYRVALNTAFRARRRKKTVGCGLAPGDCSSLETIIEVISAENALSELPDGMRTVLSLAIIGYTHHEIAESLGISVGTSKSQLYKARSRVRTAVSGW